MLPRETSIRQLKMLRKLSKGTEVIVMRGEQEIAKFKATGTSTSLILIKPESMTVFGTKNNIKFSKLGTYGRYKKPYAVNGPNIIITNNK